MKKHKLKKIEEVVERRRVEISIDKKYELDRNKLAYKTDENGELQATYILTHDTKEEEKIILYAFVENDNSQLLLKINNKEASFHAIKMPKKGELKLNFTLSCLPSGEHMVFIVSEKEMNKRSTDELEILQSQQTLAKNYFSLSVTNSKKEQNIFKEEGNFKTIKKIGESDKNNRISMELYDNSNLTKETNFIEKNKYYLVINNPQKFELKAKLKLIVDFKPYEVDQIILPANSKTVLPVTLNDYYPNNSIRYILVGQPKGKLDVALPVRIMYKTKRLPIIKIDNTLT